MATNEDELAMIAYLEELRKENPEEFAKMMSSLQQISSPNAQNQSAVGDMSQLLNAIKSKKHDNAGPVTDTLLNNGVKGITITPDPGFSFKTTKVVDGSKVFVNMAQHAEIEAPGIKKKLNDKGEEVEGMNIPMSVGPPRKTSDKKGIECLVYDIIVNPVVVEESNKDKTGKYREFICQLGIQYLEQKYKEE